VPTKKSNKELWIGVSIVLFISIFGGIVIWWLLKTLKSKEQKNK
jgi:hypothetical protein